MRIITKQVLPFINCSGIKLRPVLRISSFNYTNLYKFSVVVLHYAACCEIRPQRLTSVVPACK